MPASTSASRTAALSGFDYVNMRCNRTGMDLGKKPNVGDPWVVFHPPNALSVTYDTFFGTTHDFLDLTLTLQLYPSFVDLPLGLRPSKARYEATKANTADPSLKVRCLFCRGRFGGINSKAIWERHVKDHWPKEGQQLGAVPAFNNLTPSQAHASTSTDIRRPSRHVLKRPSGANAHIRNKSNDNGNWRPTVRRDRSMDDNVSTSSSRASSVTPELAPPPRPVPARQSLKPKVVAVVPTVKSKADDHERKEYVFFPQNPPHRPLHFEEASAICFIPKYVPEDHSNVMSVDHPEASTNLGGAPVTPKKAFKDASMPISPNWDNVFGDSPIRPIGSWDIQSDIQEHRRLASLPSTDDLLEACMELGARTSASSDQGSESSCAPALKKRSRDEDSSEEGDDEIDAMPFVKRRRVTSFHSVSSFSSYAATSDYDDSSFEASFDAADSPVADSPMIGTPGADSPIHADSPIDLLDLDKNL